MNLTLVKDSKERSIIFPTVSVNCFCALSITNIKLRLFSGFKSYHAESYAAVPIALLYRNKNKKIKRLLRFVYVTFVSVFLIM